MHTPVESTQKLTVHERVSVTPTLGAVQMKTTAAKKWEKEYEAETKKQLASIKDIPEGSIGNLPDSVYESLLKRFPQE